ncbi:AraC-like DNA-binding protein [Alkalihalobacillus xiaoxiensis]|uniref:AraC-like DNA-binding protein n=1 Tax=Shouchella xiaoxiensis TaxID=766895 RepID=A0ABS2SPC2_9BACI|nr:AraC family transcriptional regulator [Shouchella xiaoxiensis]MBM7836846.1 AraC-like DNA-binding protein [Shouchella xiaoxiensis]
MSLYNNQLRSEPHFPVVKFYYYKEWRQFEMKPHAHEAIEFMHVLSGSCKVETNTESYQLKKGQIIFLDAHTSHRLIVTEKCRMFNLEISFQKGRTAFPPFCELYKENEALRLMMTNKKPHLLLHDSDDTYQCLRRLIMEVDKKSKQTDFMVQLLLSEYLIRVAGLAEIEYRETDQQYTSRVISYIHQNYDREVRVAEIADAVHLHPGYLQRVFKVSTGTSIHEFLVLYRMKKAKAMLAETDISITDIPHYIGMNSQQYFSTTFKKYVQCTPSAYRKRHQFNEALRRKSEDIKHLSER